MGCCCSKRPKDAASPSFGGEGHRLGTAGEDKDARSARAAAVEGRQNKPEYQPYTDERLSDSDRERIRRERLAAAEGRLTKQEKKAMKAKKKSDAPLRGPNSQNTMRWTAG
mmetsp:Transcript_15628/g.35984  ORF Transcript_15628/g.35984 Transcript_15628/m.35984 type:complete len:111 (-) Transcript_15628:121-453(-)